MAHSETQAPVATLLVATDGSTLGNLALDQALEQLSLRGHAELHVLKVEDARLTASEGTEQPELEAAGVALRNQVEERLDAASKKGLTWDRPIALHLATGPISQQVIQLASDLDADLIVVGSHGREGLSRLVLGSVAESVLREAGCPVLVVRDADFEAQRAPEIEAPCPRCVEARKASKGSELWCEQHSERHGRRHTYLGGQRASGAHAPYAGGISS